MLGIRSGSDIVGFSDVVSFVVMICCGVELVIDLVGIQFDVYVYAAIMIGLEILLVID